MENKRFLTAQDVMEMLGVSLSYSYKTDTTAECGT